MSSGANASAVSAADGVATGVASRRKRVKGSAMSSADGVTGLRLSRNDGTRARTLRRKAIARPRRARSRPARLLQRAYRSTTSGGHVPANFSEASRRNPAAARRRPLGGQPGALDEHGGVVGLEREQFLEQPLRLGVGVRSAGVLDLLDERRAGLETARIELDGAAQAARCPRRAGHATSRDGPSETRPRSTRAPEPRAFDRGAGSVELAQSQVRQAEIGPRRRLAGRECGRLRELLPCRVDQADLQPRETAVEPPGRLLVRLGPRRRKSARRLSVR